MKRDLLLTIDIGTGSVRAAIVNCSGQIIAFAAKENDQIVPHFGWSQQSPKLWWEGAKTTIKQVLEKIGKERIAAIAACGQMHATVLIDAEGELTLEQVPLWNDKRTRSIVDQFSREHDTEKWLSVTANPPSVAWPAFKIAWIKQHEPAAYEAAETMFMPKDYINFKLTGERAIDFPEATCTYLLDTSQWQWSEELTKILGIECNKLPRLISASEVLGVVSEQAAKETGLESGVPVMGGAGDYPMALLGSGVTQPGMGSDITGTSTLITLITEKPVLDPMITNVQGVAGYWGAFTILDAGGDAMRWARRAFHEKKYSYDQIVELAAEAPAGADHLLFLPYLNGERLGDQTNSRAQFFGLTSAHGASHLHRAVMEGVAFASRRNIELMKARGNHLERVVAAAGGAKTPLWLEIKASIYGCPLLTPVEAECSVLGCAILAGTGAGFFNNLEEATTKLVRYSSEIQPNPDWVERYQKMQTLFDDLYESSAQFWGRLEKIG